MSPIKVFIAVKAAKYRSMLTRLLVEQDGFIKLGESGTRPATLTKVAKMQPHVLLMDSVIAPPGKEEFIESVRTVSPATKVVVLPPKYVRSDELRVARAGARGYLPKKMVGTALPKAVRVVTDGEIWMRKETVSQIFDEYVQAASLKKVAGTDQVTSLTQRELSILQLVVKDKSRRDIAKSLHTNERSVERTLTAIANKLR